MYTSVAERVRERDIQFKLKKSLISELTLKMYRYLNCGFGRHKKAGVNVDIKIVAGVWTETSDTDGH